ncbi:MAG: radical SAM protein [Thermoplasmatales archaeon]|nr:radical SAM protein [Thermoplasmatales archaeon]
MKEKTIRINEIFYSIQGEGIQIGIPTVFIRTQGCLFSCSWCDTVYARDFEKGKDMKVSEIIKKVKKYPAKYVCVTGGEPLLQKNVKFLISRLLKRGYNVNLETNGSVSLNGLPKSKNFLISMDVKCPSSKMEKRVDFRNIKLLKKTDQLKFVLKDKKDYDYAKNIIKKYKPGCNIVFMPVGGTNAKKFAENVLKNGLNVRVLIQLHKVIWGDKRGK